MEGLFRVPGPAAYTEELRKAFEEGTEEYASWRPVSLPLSLLSPAGRDPLAYSKKTDIAAVASVLKAYFRELSTPLFPTDKYMEFIQCTSECVGGCLTLVVTLRYL